MRGDDLAYNKVIYNKKTLIDLTGDTVAANTMLTGTTAHNKAGTKITGTLFGGYPNEVKIPVSGVVPTTSTTKEKNIVKFNKKTLIDLSADTVNEYSLLYGYKCHSKAGNVIGGKFLSGYPSEASFSDSIQDSSGNVIKDSSSNNISSRILYGKGSTANNIITYKRK